MNPAPPVTRVAVILLEPEHSAGAPSLQSVSRIHDRLRVLGDLAEVEHLVSRRDHDTVHGTERARAKRGGAKRAPRVPDGIDVGIGEAHGGAFLLEQIQDVERGRFPYVVDIRLVRHAQYQDARAAHRLALRVQRLADALHDVIRHASVDLPRQLDEPRLEAALPRLPGEVEGIDGDAVAPEAGTRIEGHEAEGLRGG